MRERGHCKTDIPKSRSFLLHYIPICLFLPGKAHLHSGNILLFKMSYSIRKDKYIVAPGNVCLHYLFISGYHKLKD
jgi:hypothetical protein